MKNILAIFLPLFLFLWFSGITYGNPVIVLKPHKSINSCISANQSITKEATQGCCSHHQGVCGCSGGRAVCCDGQYSPSCGCNSDSIKDLLIKESPKG